MKQAEFEIVSSCQISSTKVLVNQQLLWQHQQEEEDWFSAIYKNLGLAYPKFFKMDRLCKAGILGSELLLKDYPFDKENVKTSWGIILCNSASSLDNDRKYQETIAHPDNYYPSPSLFVYTLANIVTGEIAIRHKIGGESSFYVMPQYNADFIQELINQSYIANPEFNHLIGGWINVDEQEIDVQLMLTKRKI